MTEIQFLTAGIYWLWQEFLLGSLPFSFLPYGGIFNYKVCWWLFYIYTDNNMLEPKLPAGLNGDYVLTHVIFCSVEWFTGNCWTKNTPHCLTQTQPSRCYTWTPSLSFDYCLPFTLWGYKIGTGVANFTLLCLWNKMHVTL